MIRVIFHIKNAIYSIFWYLWNIAHIEKYFETKGIINFKVELFPLWKPHAQYFSGYQKSSHQKVFVKFGKKYFINREFNAIQFLTSNLPSKSWLPTIIDSEFDWKFPNIIINYIDGKPLNKFQESLISDDIKDTLSQTFFDIIVSLNSLNIIHRDIRPHNIMVSDTNDIVLLDYAFLTNAKDSDSEFKEIPLTYENLGKLHRLGNRYNPEIGKWDDAYSVFKICEELHIETSHLTKIKDNIGKLSILLNGDN